MEKEVVCLECGSKYKYRGGVYNSIMPTPKGEVTPEKATMRQCTNDKCVNFNIHNWCVLCEEWYPAEQPRRPEGSPQCPKCRGEWYRNKAIKKMGETDEDN